MASIRIRNWSTTPASNATVGSINWAEGQAPSTVNDSARQEMADVAEWYAAMLLWDKKSINGLTYSNTVADATNDLDIASGSAIDTTGAYWMTCSSLTKQSDANWAVGTNAGGLDTGAVGNSDYYIWLIARSDTGVVDVLYSLSSSAPTMPTNYDFKRLIGWFKRSGGTIVAFTTTETEGGGLNMRWTVPTLDVNLANTLTTTRRTDTAKVPTGFAVDADVQVQMFDSSTAGNGWVGSPDVTDAAVSASASDTNMAWTNVFRGFVNKTIRTSATGTIAARADLSTVDLYQIATVGFRWARRN